MSIDQGVAQATAYRYRAETPWGPWWALVAAAVLTLLCIGGSIVVALLLHVGTGADFKDFSRAIGWLPMVVFQILMVAGTIWLAGWFKGWRWRVLALDRLPPSFAHVLLYFTLLGIASFAYTSLLYGQQPDVVRADTDTFGPMVHSSAWLAYALIIAVGAPLSEEILFRGFLQSALAKSRLGFAGASVITTAAWTSLHIQYSIFGLAEIVVVGLVLCWVLRRTGSLWATIAMHALYNGVQFVGVALRLFPWT